MFNYTYEKNPHTKNIRASHYISLGLERLKERFVLIDVAQGTYEFLHASRENQSVLKTGPYSEFLNYLLDAVADETDKARIAEFFELQSITNYLATNNLILSALKAVKYQQI